MATQTTVNGVNVDQLFGVIDAIKESPTIAGLPVPRAE